MVRASMKTPRWLKVASILPLCTVGVLLGLERTGHT
jgi:hypothetical protein